MHALKWLAIFVLPAWALLACSPTVKVEAPERPIEINMNVKIEHEIRVRVEKDIEELLQKQSDLF
jgi:hypothetical protein